MIGRCPAAPATIRRRWAARAAVPAVLLAIALTVAGGRAAAQTAPPPTTEPAPGTTALTYRLAADWFDVSYTGTMARIRVPIDVSSAPDGTVFVLESNARYQYPPGNGGPRVHVIAPDGTLRTVVDLSPWLRNARSLDAGWDGTLAVVGLAIDEGNAVNRVLRFETGGRYVGHWDIPGPNSNDVAVLPDGRIVVADTGGNVDVVDPSGGTRQHMPLSGMGIDPAGSDYEYYITRIDAALDGRITVLVEATRPCPQPTFPPFTPRPTATPRPSLAEPAPHADRPDARSGTAQGSEPCTKWLAVTLLPTLAVERTVTLKQRYADIAVRDGAVFGATDGRSGEALRVTPIGQDEPHVSYLAPELFVGGRRGSYRLDGLAIDVAPDGGIIAVWSGGDPFTNGPARIGVPGGAAVPPVGLGYSDVPALTGPVRPRAVSAGSDRLFVLDGAYAVAGAELSGARTVDIRSLYNAAQLWTYGGRLVGQWGQRSWDNWQLGPSISLGGAPEDFAAVGDRLYTATPGGIWLRTNVLEPDWFSGTPGVRLIAVDADEAAVVAFDAAGSRVVVWTPDGRQIAAWPVTADGRAVAASDLTVGGGRVYVADTGRNRILVRSLDGVDLGEWRTHDGPQRLDRTADGDLVVLGRGGWGLRYTVDGTLRAAWRMPGATGAKRSEGTDITAGPDGSVFVTHSRVSVGSLVDRSQDVIEAAGVWRFELSVPPPGTEPPSPDVRHCLVDVDKAASPGRVRLGAPVSIVLTVQGDCPKVPLPEQVLFVVDTSWSMNDGYLGASIPPGALERARRVLVPLLGALDPSVVDVGLVTFGDGAALQTVLSDDIADLRSRILRAQADGDTRMGAGVDLARGELNGPRRVADARRAIVIVSDGVFKDDPRAAIAAARADGIDVHALVVTTPEFTNAIRASLVAMLGADHLHVDPSPERAEAVIDAVGAWRLEPNVFDALTVRDVVPANMRFVVGSPAPPAAWDAATRTLTWTLPQPAGTRVTLTYAVVPEDAGTWPTNVEADVTWRDVRGGAGQLRFPVPHVDVVAGTRVYLPYAGRAICAAWRRPLDLVLVHDVSSSMGEPAADGVHTKLGVAVEAAQLFVARLDPLRDRAAVVAFDAQARVAAPLSGDLAVASDALATLRPGFGTRIDRGLREAIDVVVGDMRGLALPVVVLLSDGLQNGPADPVRALLPELRDTGARVFVIGYGADADHALLREIAGDAADYRFAPAVEDLRAVYEGVGRTLLCP